VLSYYIKTVVPVNYLLLFPVCCHVTLTGRISGWSCRSLLIPFGFLLLSLTLVFTCHVPSPDLFFYLLGHIWPFIRV